MSARRASRGAGEAARRRHAWLELLQTDGPFLTLPVVDRVLPDGLARVPDGRQPAAVRAHVARALEDRGASRHRAVAAVLRDLLDWGEHLLLDDEVPAALAEVVDGRMVRPDFAFAVDDAADPEEEALDDGDEESSSEPAATPVGRYRLLGMLAPWGAHPLARTADAGRPASPVERLARLLRARDVPIGLVTDARWWALVWAPRGGTTGAAVWDASLFGEEPQSLRAFVALLQLSRFTGVAARDRLPALLLESLDAQEEVTETLGEQVRDAVELLVATLDRLDAESGGRLLEGVDDDALYEGVVTVMMRIVFLLFAEERRLLPSDQELYLESYAIGRLVDELEQRAQLAGEHALEHGTGAWHRLLATSRAVHGGVAHEDLRLPAYGGGLFDPDRSPWLEGRRPGEPVGPAVPPPVDDRTVLRMLRAVQYVDVGGERRRLTFRTLDVEQIGYVYEGLLDLEVRTAEVTMLHFHRVTSGTKRWPRQSKVSEVPLAEAITWTGEGRAALVDQLDKRVGMSRSRLERELGRALEEVERRELRHATAGVLAAEEAAPYVAVLHRRAERPAITLPGRRYVGPSTRRAATGTHYTPRSLAEDVVEHTLDALVYRPGPLEQREGWQLRPSSELLDLRIADIAMGSGAFLVAACRYLADKLVQAWELEGSEDALRAAAARQGEVLAADAEVDSLLLKARRLVAEHCLYGVDISPLAVEMAKLSLWLVTMDRERPFGFLDDRLKCGDSLLGLVDFDQLRLLHVDPQLGRQLRRDRLDFSGEWRGRLQQAADVRRRITATPVDSVRDVEHKQRLLAEAEALTKDLVPAASAVTGRGMASTKLKGKRLQDAFEDLQMRVSRIFVEDSPAPVATDLGHINEGRPEGREARRPFHWPLAFPEVLVDTDDPGFDAIIGNPPFLDGRKISGAMGRDFLGWIQRWDGGGEKGSADLAARFVLRAQRLLSSRGQLGYVATNTLVQGATLEVGLLQATERGLVVRSGRSSHPWPARTASLEIVHVWASHAPVAPAGRRRIDDEDVPSIGADLEPVGRVRGRPQTLPENESVAFQGHNILGLGFTVTPEAALALLHRDPHNGEALQPYVIGQDLNRRPDTSASRWVINFREWPLEQAEEYPDLISIVRQEVLPERLQKDVDRYPRMVHEWWKFWQYRQGLERAIADLDYVLAISRVGSVLLPVRVATGPVFSEAAVVFASNDLASLAVLSSSVHQAWVIRYTSTLETRIRYAPSDVFETFPRPQPTTELEKLGERLDTERRELMLGRAWGLTTTYNHVHDPADRDPAIIALRDLHTAIDHAVLDAYGWADLDPEIGHHPTKIGTRWTLSPTARFELLDRLLEENHGRAGLL